MNPDTLALTIFVTLILSFICWLYHSTILPSIRYGLRLDLFRLRDELRQMVIDGLLQEEDPAFPILDAQLSSMISHVSRFDITIAFTRVKEAERKKIEEFAEKRHGLVCEHRLPEVQRIDRQAFLVMSAAFVLNSLIISLLAIPVLLVMALVTAGIKKCVSGLKTMFYGWMMVASFEEEDNPLMPYLQAAPQPLPATRHGR